VQKVNTQYHKIRAENNTSIIHAKLKILPKLAQITTFWAPIHTFTAYYNKSGTLNTYNAHQWFLYPNKHIKVTSKSNNSDFFWEKIIYCNWKQQNRRVSEISVWLFFDTVSITFHMIKTYMKTMLLQCYKTKFHLTDAANSESFSS